MTINWLIEQFESALAKRAVIKHLPLHKTNLKSSWADIAKAKRLLGWKPQVSLEEGIRKTVEWHQANRAWLDDIRL